MSYKIIKYESKYFDKWNEFIVTSMNGTIFHRLDFLEYHGDKFTNNIHHLMFFKGEALVAVMPNAIFVENGKTIARSPFGGSFGGIVTQKPLNFSDSLTVVQGLKEYLKLQSVDTLYLTDVPSVYNDNFD